LDAQFQPVTAPSGPAAIEMVDVELKSYLQTPPSKPRLTNPEEVQEASGVSRWQGSGSERYPEMGAEAFSHADDIPTRPNLQQNPVHPSLFFSLEAISIELHI
jgi:hypothetical protein